MRDDARWTAVFDRIALFLTLLGFLLREWTPGASAGAGLNLFIHLLFWVALTLWFAGRATGDGADYRFTGFEFAFLAFAVVALLSVQRASFRLAALDQAFTWLSFGLLFLLLVQLVGRRLLLSIVLTTLFTISLYAVLQKLWLIPSLQSTQGLGVEMARRIGSNEPWGTFIGPNQLAGFLVLLLPPAFGAMMDRRDFKLRGAGLALGLVALAFTGSLGGWVSLACGIVAMLGLWKIPNRRLLVSVGGGAVAVMIGLLLWSPLLSALGRHSHSMHVRQAYWQATGPIIARSPLLGVGLDNWEEYYFQTKPETQQETKKAHNDYLQVLAETGVVGLLAFAGLLGLGLKKALDRESAPEPEPSEPPALLVLAAAAVPILLAVLKSADVAGTAVAIVLGAAWIGGWLLERRGTGPADATWTRIGLAGGLAGFLVHMVVDFQIYDYGILAALVAALALIAMFRGGAAAVRIPKAVCGAATAVLLAVTAPLLMMTAPRVMAADTEIDEAQAALLAADSGWVPDPAAAVADAARLSQSAQNHNPFDPNAYLVFSRAKFREWLVLRRDPKREPRKIEEAEGMVLQALENAIQLRPLLSPLHAERARHHADFRRYYLKDGRGSEMAAVKAAEHLRQAIEDQRRAVALYPTYCRNVYDLARLLETARDPAAADLYREALRLGDLAGRELENLDRLKLEPIAQARCLNAIGKPLEARDLIDRYFRDQVKGLPADQARKRLERVARDNEDEGDSTMTPVLNEAADAIMRSLK